MTIEEVASWLKSSVPGIIILGALGSILSIILWNFLGTTIKKIIPLPYRLHREKMTEQAYMLGFAAATIAKDETGKNLTAYMIFRLARFVIALNLFIFCFIAFILITSIIGRASLTFGLSWLVTIGFTALYWGYIEFEYIYRTYWFFWKSPISAAKKGYKRYLDEKKMPNHDAGPDR